jgi:large subunit ribosomal protein L3
MKFILGTKGKMTQVFDEEGRVYPVTAIQAGPVVVTHIKTKEKDGYDGVQVGFGTQKKARINKAQQGHSKDLGDFRHYVEYRIEGATDLKVGDAIDLSIFAKGDKVAVSSTSKGKGFQGVVKRHGFAGGRRSHGQKHSEREPGSIGATGPQRVFKGTRMGGRMGGDRVTVKNLVVVDANPATGELLIKGALPGIPGALVEIKA